MKNAVIMSLQPPEPVPGECNALKFNEFDYNIFPKRWYRCSLPAGHDTEWHEARTPGSAIAVTWVD